MFHGVEDFIQLWRWLRCVYHYINFGSIIYGLQFEVLYIVLLLKWPIIWHYRIFACFVIHNLVSQLISIMLIFSVPPSDDDNEGYAHILYFVFSEQLAFSQFSLQVKVFLFMSLLPPFFTPQVICSCSVLFYETHTFQGWKNTFYFFYVTS